MVLSNELLSQFAKITKDDKATKNETTVYGTITKYNGGTYVRLDGSELITPVIVTADANEGERVTVLLKNHSATVTGNISSPAARVETVRVVTNNVEEFNTILADVVRTETFTAAVATITQSLNANSANIKTLTTDNADVKGRLTAAEAAIKELVVEGTITTEFLDATYAKISSLNATNATINNLTSRYGTFENLTTETLNAYKGRIETLETNTLTATQIASKYANINFSNIGKAAIENFYSKSGLIDDLVVGDGTVTGELVGVTISGDLIKANTLVADKLIIKGANGLYYKLNTDGVTTEAEQTAYNSLNGSVILAKSITATKINVSDLVAFGATIGGFHISEDSIYSGVKETVDNTTRGMYLDNDGQVAFGDANNFIKYYKDADGTYKLTIAANTVTFGIGNTNVETVINGTIRLANAAQASADAAAKTATDYMNLSSAGLVVGQNPSSPTAGNTLISTDGVSIRKGTTVLAAFKAASRTASGITSATLTSTDSTDSESDGVTSVRGTIKKNETRANIYITTNGNPVYFPKGLETDKVLINNNGIILNDNIVIDGSIVDNSGEGILTPLNSYGNMVIGYGRYQDGGATHVYGTRVKAKTKTGFSASVNGVAALDTNNASGNATFGWHLYEANTGETNIYGKTTSLFAKSDIRLNANGNAIRANGSIVPYEANVYNLGASSLSFRNVYFSSVNDGSMHGIRYANSSGSTYNAIGVNEDGYIVYGNTDYCTNIIGRSTTTSNTGYSFKITCGDNPALVIGDNDARLFLFGGTDSTSRYIGSITAYKRTYTSAANMVVTENGIIGRATSSSRRYKKDISDLSLDSVKGLYNLPVRQFKYNDDSIASDDERYGIDIPGFIAEEVAECLPVACDHIRDSNGDLIPEMWNSKIIVPALLKLIQDLNNRVKNLEEKGA